VAGNVHLADAADGGTLVLDPPGDSGSYLAPPHKSRLRYFGMLTYLAVDSARGE
jgi:hypothetical protein